MYSTYKINQFVGSLYLIEALRLVKTAFFKSLKKNAKNTITQGEVNN